MGYRQSPEEELLDEIVQSILERDKARGGNMSYNEARAKVENMSETTRGIVGLKMRKVLATLGKVAYKNLSSRSIDILENSTKDDDEMDGVIQMALMIMLRDYRSQFMRLMRQWGADPKPYIEAYIDTKH